MELDLEDREPTVLEYARFYGLCKDYTVELPGLNAAYNMPERIISIIDQEQDPIHPSVVTNRVSTLTKERLALNKEAALLLQSVHSLSQLPDSMSLVPEGRSQVLSLKKELPILHTDNEFDVLGFGNAAMPDLRRSKIPSEKVNSEEGEGFEWPSHYLTYPSQYNERARKEKLLMTKEDFMYLQNALKDSYTTEDSETVRAKCLDKPNHEKLPLTPPLLPLSPPITPYIPSSPANYLELASEGTNSVGSEANVLEAQIMAMDSLEQTADMDDQMLLEFTEIPNLSSAADRLKTPARKRRAASLKVEGPLTPPIFPESPLKKLKSVTFTNTLLEYIPNLPSLGENSNDSKSPITDNAIFEEFEAFGKEADRMLENEKLSGADTTSRADVPVVDFSLPIAPWYEYSRKKCANNEPNDTELSVQRRFLLRVKREDLKSATSWHGASKLERHLPMNIFTCPNPKVLIQEKLHGESELNKMLCELTLGAIATSATEAWKKEGLRILDEDEDDEEELEQAIMPSERYDMVALVRKRKLEMDEEKADTANPTHTGDALRQRKVHKHVQTATGNANHEIFDDICIERGSPSQAAQFVSARQLAGHEQDPGSKLLQTHTDSSGDLLFGGFSISTALDQFMRTRGKSMKSAESSPKTKKPNSVLQGVFEANIQSPEVQLSPLPRLPSIPAELPPCSFIISSSLLQQRCFLKQIENLYEGAELVYRDFKLPHSPAGEADLILSPSTGLIFTTLQQLKQRALPGQIERSAIKERTLALQLRYERLVIMVSEGLSREIENSGSGRPVDSRDTEAVDQFKSFAERMDAEILVNYVRGGEQALARYTVKEMSTYGLRHGSVDMEDMKLIEAETNWELFLRRCGLNPFAAQAIISALREHIDMPLRSDSYASSQMYPRTVSMYGLSAFLSMDEEERVKSFQVIMGGSRILKRVSKMLDQDWISASHGFRM